VVRRRSREVTLFAEERNRGLGGTDLGVSRRLLVLN